MLRPAIWSTRRPAFRHPRTRLPRDGIGARQPSATRSPRQAAQPSTRMPVPVPAHYRYPCHPTEPAARARCAQPLPTGTLMLCPKCSTEVRAGHRFCTHCGTPLNNFCALCGFANLPGARFCGGCGEPQTTMPTLTPTTTQTPVTVPAETVAGLYDESQAERRQLTVMFCELVRCGDSSEALDPEVLRNMLRDYERSCARVTA
ncbi:MAG: zinc ribbon domain-containing protein, partial [Gammaproteobacteria bacterium]|nr:zinc ribbon domain-containing protein [Gammaproteobacteria bacterium]